MVCAWGANTRNKTGVLAALFLASGNNYFQFFALFSGLEFRRGASARRSYFVVPERLSLARNNILIFTAK